MDIVVGVVGVVGTVAVVVITPHLGLDCVPLPLRFCLVLSLFRVQVG